MPRTCLTDLPPKDAQAESPRADRLATVRQRLADGYYRRPEVLDRLVAAVLRALGRTD